MEGRECGEHAKADYSTLSGHPGSLYLSRSTSSIRYAELKMYTALSPPPPPQPVPAQLIYEFTNRFRITVEGIR